MKVKRQLAKLEEMILQPLEGVTGEDWHRAPKGRWSLAQTLSHMAQGLDLVAGRMEARAVRTDMARRATPGQHLLRHLALGVGKLPLGRQTPEATRPPERPDPELVAAQFRMGVERLATLAETWPAERHERIFVRHPVLGDLNLPEWGRFFYVHGRHHAHQIEVRQRWLKQQAQKEQKGPREKKGQKGQGKGEKGPGARQHGARSERKR
jgi:hypothetical protein